TARAGSPTTSWGCWRAPARLARSCSASPTSRARPDRRAVRLDRYGPPWQRLGVLDHAAVARLLDRTRREVDDGLLPAAQIAVGWQGEIVVEATFGAPDGARILGFSTTKALVGAAVWRLVGEGSLDLEAPVAHYLPAFGANGKERVTGEQDRK